MYKPKIIQITYFYYLELRMFRKLWYKQRSSINGKSKHFKIMEDNFGNYLIFYDETRCNFTDIRN